MADAEDGTYTAGEGDPILIGCTMLYTKLEIETANNVNALILAKAEHVKQSFIQAAIDQINKRGWATVEYAQNTTGMA